MKELMFYIDFDSAACRVPLKTSTREISMATLRLSGVQNLLRSDFVFRCGPQEEPQHLASRPDACFMSL